MHIYFCFVFIYLWAGYACALCTCFANNVLVARVIGRNLYSFNRVAQRSTQNDSVRENTADTRIASAANAGRALCIYYERLAVLLYFHLFIVSMFGLPLCVQHSAN